MAHIAAIAPQPAKTAKLTAYPKNVGDWLNLRKSLEQIVPVPLSWTVLG
jgi:hypothetical protein